MTTIVTSFRTSESLFTPYNKVPYPNFARCFSVMPILLVQFIIIPPIDYYYFLLMSLEASNFQFSVHITTENSCPWLTHFARFLPCSEVFSAFPFSAGFRAHSTTWPPRGGQGHFLSLHVHLLPLLLDSDLLFKPHRCPPGPSSY